MESSIFSTEVEAFTRTQPKGGITKLLSCGARAFDLRIGPKVYQ